MCIDKKLQLIFLLIFTFTLEAMAQVPARFSDEQDGNVRVQVDIFPNPTSDFIHVEIKESEFRSVGFEMYNIIGSSIKVDAEKVKNSLYKIPVKDLANGYYMLIVKDDESRYRKAFKFMKI